VEESHTVLPTQCVISRSTLASESKPTLAKVLSGFASTMRDRVFQDGARSRFCPDRVRELSASITGSVLAFQGVGESYYKMLARKKNERISTMPFLLWHFSPGDKTENCSAQFLAVC